MVAERILMGLLLGGIAIGCGFVLRPFFTAILWAAILAFCTFPVFQWIRRNLRVSPGVAAAIMVVLAMLLIVLPLGVAVPGGAQDADRIRLQIQHYMAEGLPMAPDWLANVPLVGATMHDYWNAWAADLSTLEHFLRPYFGSIAENGLAVLLSIAGGLAHFVLALIIAFFFWWGGEALAGRLTALLLRIAGEYAPRLIAVAGSTVRGVVYGILGTALVQGILTSIGLWISGVPRPALLGAIAGFLAVLPIGAPLVWIPAAIWLLGTGHTAWGLFLGIYGVVLVSGADHLIRPYFIARGAKLPFLLTFLGVLGGALAFGLVGVFLGPVLLGVGFTLVAEFARVAEPDAAAPLEN